MRNGEYFDKFILLDSLPKWYNSINHFLGEGHESNPISLPILTRKPTFGQEIRPKEATRATQTPDCFC